MKEPPSGWVFRGTPHFFIMTHDRRDRQARNRESARRYRLRRKRHVACLEARCDQLTRQVQESAVQMEQHIRRIAALLLTIHHQRIRLAQLQEQLHRLQELHQKHPACMCVYCRAHHDPLEEGTTL